MLFFLYTIIYFWINKIIVLYSSPAKSLFLSIFFSFSLFYAEDAFAHRHFYQLNHPLWYLTLTKTISSIFLMFLKPSLPFFFKCPHPLFLVYVVQYFVTGLWARKGKRSVVRPKRSVKEEEPKTWVWPCSHLTFPKVCVFPGRRNSDCRRAMGCEGGDGHPRYSQMHDVILVQHVCKHGRMELCRWFTCRSTFTCRLVQRV